MKNITLLLMSLFFYSSLIAQIKHIKYHNNDNVHIAEEGQFANNGTKTGEWRYYYFDKNSHKGPIEKVGEYKNDKESGIWKLYYNNATNDLLAIGSFENGKESGEWKMYYTTGNLWKIGKSYNGKSIGEWKSFYDNGQIEGIGSFDDYGNKIGTHFIYFENGEIKTQSHYENGIETSVIIDGKYVEKSRGKTPINYNEFTKKVPLENLNVDQFDNTLEYIKLITSESDYKIVVYTGVSWCAPCVLQVRELSKLVNEKKIDRNLFIFLDFLNVDSPNKNRAIAEYTETDFLNNSNITYKSGSVTSEKNLISSLPGIFIFKNNELVDAYFTFMGENFKENLETDLKMFLEDNGF